MPRSPAILHCQLDTVDDRKRECSSGYCSRPAVKWGGRREKTSNSCCSIVVFSAKKKNWGGRRRSKEKVRRAPRDRKGSLTFRCSGVPVGVAGRGIEEVVATG